MKRPQHLLNVPVRWMLIVRYELNSSARRDRTLYIMVEPAELNVLPETILYMFVEGKSDSCRGSKPSAGLVQIPRMRAGHEDTTVTCDQPASVVQGIHRRNQRVRVQVRMVDEFCPQQNIQLAAQNSIIAALEIHFAISRGSGMPGGGHKVIGDRRLSRNSLQICESMPELTRPLRFTK